VRALRINGIEVVVSNGFLERLVREAGVDDLLEALTARLAPSDLQSLMLTVYSRVASKSTPRRLVEQYERDRFVRPAEVDVRILGELDRIAWSLLPTGYRAMELSPLCPLGTSSVVAPVNQNKVVSTSRNSEVVSDSTNVMALECAVRRREDNGAPVLLAASQRLTRAQKLPGPRSWAHFRLLSLCAAGRDDGSFSFEVESVVTQIRFHLRYLEALIVAGWQLDALRIALTDFSGGRVLPTIEKSIVAPLRTEFPQAEVAIDPTRKSGRGYYGSVCFKVFVRERAGGEMEIGDGGDVPWTQKLLSNAKERLVISAIAQERLAAVR
jgi:hypothetical protein